MTARRNVAWNQVIQVLDLISNAFKEAYTSLNLLQASFNITERSTMKCPNAPRIRPMRGRLEEIPSFELPPSAINEDNFAFDDARALG